MNIIIPMAGMGKRMRPHTLTVPKPLIKIAGKPIVHRLVEGIAQVCGESIDEVAFVVGRFGEAVETELKEIAEGIGAKASIYYQDEALGTAHAVYCAQQALNGKVVVAFADTLFRAEFKLDVEKDGIIWVQKIEDPSAFGVVKLNSDGVITDFVEKPQDYVSDLAIIGIYYFKSGELLKEEIQHLLENDIRTGGEFQLTDALESLKKKGILFYPGAVDEWMDCGNKNATVATNSTVLNHLSSSELRKGDIELENSVIIEPCYLGQNVKIKNSVIGPGVSVGNATSICNSIISESIIQEECEIHDMNIHNSMIGNHAKTQSKPQDLSISDYSVVI